MAVVGVIGPITWTYKRDKDGHEDYTADFIVETAYGDGPSVVRNAAGLPQTGANWDYFNDFNEWAYCKTETDIKIHDEREGDPTRFHRVTKHFSTRPDTKSCKDFQFSDPLEEPDRISGSFVKFVEEAAYDRYDQRITNSAHEQIRGPQVEFDGNRPQIVIEQNVADLQLPMLSAMVDTVNKYSLWGLPPRCIKLSEAPWERKFYAGCAIYFTRKLTFDIRHRWTGGVDRIPPGLTGTGTGTQLGPAGTGTGTDQLGTPVYNGRLETFDRFIADEGTKAISGHIDKNTGKWVLDNVGGSAPNPLNPLHFVRYKDRNGENSRVILDGHGRPWDFAGLTTGTGDDTEGKIFVEKYGESDFRLLGIPLDFAVLI